jgi:hypothetical protein
MSNASEYGDAERFPIGRYAWPKEITAADRERHIAKIAAAAAGFRAAVAGLTPEQFDTPYREGGWTVRQVIAHVPDSHMNCYVRFKLALTEDTPTIKPYDEAAWAELADTKNTPPEVSLTLLESLHTRWVALLRTLSEADWKREFRHPEIGTVSLEGVLGSYAWHCDHHTAHISRLRQRRGW